MTTPSYAGSSIANDKKAEHEAGHTLDRSSILDGDKQPLTFTTMGNLEMPLDLIHISLDCRRKPEDLQEAHKDTRRTNSIQKAHSVNPGIKNRIFFAVK